jgi:hypothetical protein
MSRITYDFTVVRSDIPGVRLIVAHNEDAFSYLTDEADLQTLPDGSAPLMDFHVKDFVSDAERAQLCTAYV